MDELSPLFQEIEFHERYRGYDPDEVDAFVDRVARAAAVMRGRISELHERIEAAEARRVTGAGKSDTEETLTRTLVLAQRTADAAIAEAREEADRLTADAATSAQAILSAAEAEATATVDDATERASKILAEAETDRRTMVAEAEALAGDAALAERERIAAEVAELHEFRAFLADDIEVLEWHLTKERQQLTASLAALADLLDSPEIFRAVPAPATSGVEIDVARFSGGIDPVDATAAEVEAAEVEVAEVEAAEVESPAESVEPAEILEPAAGALPAYDVDAEGDDLEYVTLEDEAFEDEALEDEALEDEALEDEALEDVAFDDAAFDELAFDDVVAPTFVPADEPATIDLVAAEAEAASVDVAVAADFDLDQPASVSDPDPDPEPGSGSAPAKPEPPTRAEPAFAGMSDHALAETPGPRRLVTVADLETAAAPSGQVGYEPSTRDRFPDDGGPVTEAMPVLSETSLFAEAEAVDDPFVARLRDAVRVEAMSDESDDEALSAFFDQEDDDSSRSWFGRRR